MVRLDNVSLSFSGQVIFDDVDWQTKENDRVALIGPNGAGKTTLLRMIAGEVRPERGSVIVPKGTVIGYMPQETVTLGGSTVFREVRSVLSEALRLGERLGELERALAETDPESHGYRDILEDYGRLQERFELLDGWQIDARVNAVLDGLGFGEKDRDRPVEEFSGGWQMRMILAKLLLSRPGILLLDEPTNHLDIEARNWLEDYLNDYPGTIVLVSHDRFFIDRVTHRITEIEHGKVTDYHTSYAGYLEEKEVRYECLAAEVKRQQESIRHIQDFIDRNRYDKRRASLVQSRIKMLEKMDLITLPPRPKRVRFRFPDPPRSGRIVLELKNVRKSYDSAEVFRDASLVVERGERIALVGPNGAGKSTLMRIIAGTEPCDGGEVNRGHNVFVRFMDQEVTSSLDMENTVLDELRDVAPFDILPQMRSLLGAFLFSGDDVDKRVAVLSGGEKSRLALAKMLLERSNLLLLDEPTNHLDIASQDILLSALEDFSGTIVFVSHERYFINRLTRKIIEVSDGRLRIFFGDYEDYLEKKEAEARSGPAAPAVHPDRAKRKEETLRARDRRKEAERARRRQSRELESLERDIRRTEKEIEDVEAVLSDPDLYREGEKARRHVTKHEELRESLSRLYERWVELEEEMESSAGE